MESWGLESRCGTSGSSVWVVTTTAFPPSVRTLSCTPSRIRGLGLALAAAVNDAATCSAVRSVPSWNFTPARSSKRQFLPSSCVQAVESDGWASPRASRTTKVSAVFQRESLKASSLKGVSPERGGCSMATLIRESVLLADGAVPWAKQALRRRPLRRRGVSRQLLLAWNSHGLVPVFRGCEWIKRCGVVADAVPGRMPEGSDV